MATVLVLRKHGTPSYLSVKWVGFFVTALVGLYTIEDLWFKLGDWSMPKMNFLWHFVARVIGLILIPAAVYVASFYLHFLVLSHSGPVRCLSSIGRRVVR